jgi:hypothetical protein
LVLAKEFVFFLPHRPFHSDDECKIESSVLLTGQKTFATGDE